MSKSTKVGSVPSEANLKGTINEGVPEEQKVVKVPKDLDAGPKRTADGAFKPAAYSTPNGNVRVDR